MGFGISVLSGAMTIFLDFTPGAAAFQVGIREGPPSLQPPLSSTEGATSASLQLLPDDAEITLQVFVDRTLVEAYWMDGRVAMTSAASPSKAVPESDQVEVFTSVDGVELSSAVAWGMESIWVSKEEVLATPRTDGSLRSVVV